MNQSTYDIAYKIIQRLMSQGFIAYFAGGWVRDFLMGHPSDDIDIATDASPQEVQELFEKTIPVGIQFGIVIVVLEDHQFEVATFRKDHGYEDGRRPIGIEKATPKEDASRRDFTINGMFYDPLKEQVLDYVEGREDLKKHVVRSIGNAHQRFLEDRLRMIRAIRYTCRFHFSLDKNTKEAIIAHANSLFPSVAIERVWQEFTKMAKFGDFEKFLKLLHEVHLLETIFPDLQVVQKSSLTQRLKILSNYPKDAPIILKLCKLLLLSNAQDAIKLCEKLKISNDHKNLVTDFYRLKNSLLNFSNEPDDFTLAYFYVKDSFSICFKILLSELPMKRQKQLETFHKEKQILLAEAVLRIKNKSPLVTSKLLSKEGIEAGIIMGKLLKECERIAINENLNTAEEVIKIAKKEHFWP